MKTALAIFLATLCYLAVQPSMARGTSFCADSSIGLDWGTSLRSGQGFDLHNLMAHYSCHNNFSSLVMRTRFELGGLYNSHDSDVNQAIAGVMQDFTSGHWHEFYLSGGVGVYLKTRETKRIGSHFTFGERVALGYRLGKNNNMEIFYRHFSNGSITGNNSGYDLIGLAFSSTY